MTKIRIMQEVRIDFIIGKKGEEIIKIMALCQKI